MLDQADKNGEKGGVMAWKIGKVLSFDQETGVGTVLESSENKVFLLNYMSDEAPETQTTIKENSRLYFTTKQGRYHRVVEKIKPL